VSVPQHVESSNNAHNAHGNVPHKQAATATVAKATPPAAAAAAPASAADRTTAATSWPQVCRLHADVHCGL